MLLLEKYNYDNNIYKPDRLGLHEMSGLNKLKLKINKGIIGHIYLNHNKYRKSSESEDKFWLIGFINIILLKINRIMNLYSKI